jgi:hypothetical protein
MPFSLVVSVLTPGVDIYNAIRVALEVPVVIDVP